MSNLSDITEVLLETGPTPLTLENLSQSLSLANIGELNLLGLRVLGDDSPIALYIRDEVCKEIRKRILKSNFLLKVTYDPDEESYQCYARASTAETLVFSVDKPVSYLSKENLTDEDLSKVYNILERECQIYLTRNEGSYDITIEKIESAEDSLIINSDKWNLSIPIEKIYDQSIVELIDTLSSLDQKI